MDGKMEHHDKRNSPEQTLQSCFSPCSPKVDTIKDNGQDLSTLPCSPKPLESSISTKKQNSSLMDVNTKRNSEGNQLHAPRDDLTELPHEVEQNSQKSENCSPSNPTSENVTELNTHIDNSFTHAASSSVTSQNLTSSTSELLDLTSLSSASIPVLQPISTHSTSTLASTGSSDSLTSNMTTFIKQQQTKQQAQPVSSHKQQQQQQPHSLSSSEPFDVTVARIILNLWLAGRLHSDMLPLLRCACLYVIHHVCGDTSSDSTAGTIPLDAEQRLQMLSRDIMLKRFSQSNSTATPSSVRNGSSASSLLDSLAQSTLQPLTSSPLDANFQKRPQSLASQQQNPLPPPPAPTLTAQSFQPIPLLSRLSNSSQISSPAGGNWQSAPPPPPPPSLPKYLPTLETAGTSPSAASPDTALTETLNVESPLMQRQYTSAVQLPSTNTSAQINSTLPSFFPFNNSLGSQPPSITTEGGPLFPTTTLSAHRRSSQNSFADERWTDTETLGMGVNMDVADLLFDTSPINWPHDRYSFQEQTSNNNFGTQYPGLNFPTSSTSLTTLDWISQAFPQANRKSRYKNEQGQSSHFSAASQSSHNTRGGQHSRKLSTLDALMALHGNEPGLHKGVISSMRQMKSNSASASKTTKEGI